MKNGMIYINRIKRLLGSAFSALYLTSVIALNSIVTNLQTVYVAIYFLAVCLLIRHFAPQAKFWNPLTNKRRIKILSCSLAALILLIFPNFWVNRYHKPYVEVIPYGNIDPRGMSSRIAMNEVWILSIKVDNEEVDLSKIPLSPGWIYNDNVVVASDNNTRSPLYLPLNRAKDISITFLRHPWSGWAEIRDGSRLQHINLYLSDTAEVNAGNYLYHVQSNQKSPLLRFQDFFLYAACYVFLYNILLIFLQYSTFQMIRYNKLRKSKKG